MSETALKGVRALSKIFMQNGYKMYLVGGSVRNMICGLPATDADVCSTALPDVAAQFLREAGLNVIEKALSLGTIEMHMSIEHTKHIFEHTTFRQDYYHDGGRHRPKKVSFTTDIAQDAKRRDFTVNALYFDMESSEISDPTGRGVDDANNGIIRAAADNAIETLRDDGLRILRMVRFAAQLEFDINPDLFECAEDHASLLADISAERKRDELCKILLADVKYGKKNAHLKGLMYLRNCGALEYVLPSLCEGENALQSSEHHIYDVLGHGIHACAKAKPILTLRLAALLHDIGKPRAMKQNGNMHEHAAIGFLMARQALDSLKFDNKTKRMTLALIKNHMFDLEAKAKPNTIRKFAVKICRPTFELLIELRRADFRGSCEYECPVDSADHWQAELDVMIAKKVPWKVADLNVTGSDIIKALNIKTGEKIGEILDTLFHECVFHPGENTKENLLKRAKALK